VSIRSDLLRRLAVISKYPLEKKSHGGGGDDLMMTLYCRSARTQWGSASTDVTKGGGLNSSSVG
jgi:hypothetical protein